MGTCCERESIICLELSFWEIPQERIRVFWGVIFQGLGVQRMPRYTAGWDYARNRTISTSHHHLAGVFICGYGIDGSLCYRCVHGMCSARHRHCNDKNTHHKYINTHSYMFMYIYNMLYSRSIICCQSNTFAKISH